MAWKSERVEARLSPDERSRIDRAALLAGESVSTFVVHSAIRRADEVISAADVTVVPDDYFDALLRGLDEADAAPRLAAASTDARRRGRIQR